MGLSVGALVAGILLGAGLNAWLQVDIVPIGVGGCLQLMAVCAHSCTLDVPFHCLTSSISIQYCKSGHESMVEHVLSTMFVLQAFGCCSLKL